ncbi:MAG: hypothetical protein ACI3VN_09910 [Candidatus Onthomonas sp.]
MSFCKRSEKPAAQPKNKQPERSGLFQQLLEEKRRLLSGLEEDPVYSRDSWMNRNADGDDFHDSDSIEWYLLKEGVPLNEAVSGCVRWRKYTAEQLEANPESISSVSRSLLGVKSSIHIRIPDRETLDALGEDREAVLEQCRANDICITVELSEGRYHNFTDAHDYLDVTERGWGMCDDAATVYFRYQKKILTPEEQEQENREQERRNREGRLKRGEETVKKGHIRTLADIERQERRLNQELERLVKRCAEVQNMIRLKNQPSDLSTRESLRAEEQANHRQQRQCRSQLQDLAYARAYLTARKTQ